MAIKKQPTPPKKKNSSQSSGQIKRGEPQIVGRRTPIWKEKTNNQGYPKYYPSRSNPMNTIQVNEDGSRTKWTPRVQTDSFRSEASGSPIKSIERPKTKKPVKDTVTTYSNFKPAGTFDRGRYVEKVKPMSENPKGKNKKVTSTAKATGKKQTKNK